VGGGTDLVATLALHRLMISPWFTAMNSWSIEHFSFVPDATKRAELCDVPERTAGPDSAASASYTVYAVGLVATAGQTDFSHGQAHYLSTYGEAVKTAKALVALRGRIYLLDIDMRLGATNQRNPLAGESGAC